jgi:glycerol-3-phosphate dehydrogenase (NAD(P)+)
MNVSVLGCGRWGTFLAWYCNSIGHHVTLWGREHSNKLQELQKKHKNDYLTIPQEIHLSDSLSESIASAETIIISINAQELRNLAKQIAHFRFRNKIFILCMKGLEANTGKQLSQVFKEETDEACDVAVWVGPGHVQDFCKGIPNCMIIGSNSDEVTGKIVHHFSSELIRLYYSKDLSGLEIGAAAKNVIGIAAGMLDGLHYSSLKGALMARGAREISVLIKKMGGNELSAYGLSHLGDYEATLFSPYSHNRTFGEMFAQNKIFTRLAEGVPTVKALLLLAKKCDIELPICDAVEQILFFQKETKKMLLQLFLRPLKCEF